MLESLDISSTAEHQGVSGSTGVDARQMETTFDQCVNAEEPVKQMSFVISLLWLGLAVVTFPDGILILNQWDVGSLCTVAVVLMTIILRTNRNALGDVDCQEPTYQDGENH